MTFYPCLRACAFVPLPEYFGFVIITVSCLHFVPLILCSSPDHSVQTALVGVIYWVTSSCRVDRPPLYLSKVLDITELGQAGGGLGRGWGRRKAKSSNTAAPGYRSDERFCHKSPRNMSDAACLLFYTEGTAVVQKYWFFSLYRDRDCQPSQADLGTAQTTIPHPADRMNPTGASWARYANVHFTGTDRDQCLLPRPLLVSTRFPSPRPQSAPCDRELGARFFAYASVCVCVKMRKKKPFLFSLTVR